MWTFCRTTLNYTTYTLSFWSSTCGRLQKKEDDDANMMQMIIYIDRSMMINNEQEREQKKNLKRHKKQQNIGTGCLFVQCSVQSTNIWSIEYGKKCRQKLGRVN